RGLIRISSTEFHALRIVRIRAVAACEVLFRVRRARPPRRTTVLQVLVRDTERLPRRGAPAAHGPVQRSRRFDGDGVAPRSRGLARRGPRVPTRLLARGGTLRRLRRAVPGRRAPRVLRLSDRARG